MKYDNQIITLIEQKKNHENKLAEETYREMRTFFFFGVDLKGAERVIMLLNSDAMIIKCSYFISNAATL